MARDLDAVLLHVSTDYVFDGSKGSPYLEEDNPRPLNAYGITKLAGEHFVGATTAKHFVIRTSGLYGKSPCRAKGGLNFIELMLKLAKERGEVRVVDNEVVSPTSTAELAQQMVQLSRSDCYGLYHATAEGSCSWYEFAREIFAITDTPVRLKVAAPDEFPAKVARPKYSVLENRALKSHGLNAFKPWPVLLHVSTDYVFDGSKGSPYLEEDSPRPLNAYGITKLAGEHFVGATTAKHFVIWTSGLYGKSPCRAKGGLNFIQLMLKLAKERGEVRVVDNEWFRRRPRQSLRSKWSS